MSLELLNEKLNDSRVHVVIACAPSSRVALGEGFGFPPGTNVEGKMVAALRKLGFNRVFDLNVGADFTVVEEAAELAQRLKMNAPRPMFTSCCPMWVNYLEQKHPNLVPYLSTTKSPQQIFGALTKTYYADKVNIPPENIFLVTLMPCVLKGQEAKRHGHVDLVVTVKQMIEVITSAKINFAALPDEEFDNPLGPSSGAGAKFGFSGGVAGAVVKTLQAAHNIKNPRTFAISGIANVEKFLQEQVLAGPCNFDLVEVMGCPGGCVGGAGMPAIRNLNERTCAICQKADNCKVPASHESPIVKQVYKEFLGSPNSNLARKLLHTPI